MRHSESPVLLVSALTPVSWWGFDVCELTSVTWSVNKMVLTSEASSLSQSGIFVLMMHVLGLKCMDKQLMYEWWLFTHLSAKHLLMLSVWVCLEVKNWSCSLFFFFFFKPAVSSFTWAPSRPHQKFCLWFTCTEFPAAVDEWGRVWWVSSDHDLQHTLEQFATECEAAGMKVHTWRALPESSRKKASFDLKASCCLRLTSWVLELVHPWEEHQIWWIMGIYCAPQASEQLSYWFRPQQRHRWADTLKWSLYFGSGTVIMSLWLLFS